MKRVIVISILSILMISFVSTKTHWRDWIGENAVEIRATKNLYDDDLNFLDSLITNKRIVFLGENGHGISEFTSLKSEIIKYLHQKHNFDVIVFESNLGDAYASSKRLGELSSRDAIHQSISILWHVEEIIPLFDYIKESHLTESPIALAGVGIPISAGGLEFSNYLRSFLSHVSRDFADSLFKADSAFSIHASQLWWRGGALSKTKRDEYLRYEQDHLKRYQNLIDFLNVNSSEWKDQGELKVLKFIIESRIAHIQFRASNYDYMEAELGIKGKNWERSRIRSNFRDHQMSKYLEFIAHELYPEKKIVVWAHNHHIRRKPNNMPYHRRLKDISYNIGLFNLKGKGSLGHQFGNEANRPPYIFQKQPDSLAIEDILLSTGNKISFIDLSQQKRAEGNSWMFDASHYYEWDGSYTISVKNIKSLFDGLIVIDEVHPPDFLQYDYDIFRNTE